MRTIHTGYCIDYSVNLDYGKPVRFSGEIHNISSKDSIYDNYVRIGLPYLTALVYKITGFSWKPESPVWRMVAESLEDDAQRIASNVIDYRDNQATE